MRRKIAWMVTGLFIAGVVPASAGDQVTLKPNPVRQGKKLVVTANNCVSGSDWEAFVEIAIFNDDDQSVLHSYRPADDDGTTVKKIKMKKKKYPKGDYVVDVDCIHEFDDGSDGTWYETSHDLTVKKRKKK